MSFLTGAPVRRGYDNAAASFLFTEKIHYDSDKHEVEKLLSFVPKDEGKRYEIELFPTDLEREKVDKFLEKRKEKISFCGIQSLSYRTDQIDRERSN